MNSWYIDRSKNFLYDTLLDSLKIFYSITKGKEKVDVNVLIDLIKKHPELGIADGNINAALTRFRDHGLINYNNIVGDSAIDYIEGRLNEEELVIDLFLKRPVEKKDSPNLKPFVILCKVFDIMIDMEIDVDNIFITSYECKEYLYSLNDIDEISFELVERIINERNYELGSKIPIARVQFDFNEDTNISIWFNALNRTPIFLKKYDTRRVLVPNIKQKEFFKYISVNADEFAETPTNSKINLYNYYCNRRNGINEILPDVIKNNAFAVNDEEIKSIFEYLFGYKKNVNANFEKYFKEDCFGIFFPFISIPGLAIRKIYYSNKIIGEALYKYIFNKNQHKIYLDEFENGKFHFSSTNKKERDIIVDLKEEYEKWLINEGFAFTTVKNYVNSIIVTTKEAIEDEIINKNIYSISDKTEIIILIDKLYKNEKFLFRKNNYNHINTAALNNYLKFIENRTNSLNDNIEKYSKEKFLEDVFVDEKKYDLIISILDKKKNIILEGAPGVGKTYIARRLAYSIIGEKNKNYVEFIQFHQSYSYEDFVEGYRPDENGFELKRGIFYKLCKKALNDPSNKYYIVIDEINRGNLSKIFGELLMLIENDKRGEELTLAYSEEKFCVPENLYIIGLMNTADRSLALIDYALRRRFAFIRIEPAFDNEKFKKKFAEKFDEDFSNVISIIKNINKAIEDDKSLGNGFKIGHSYFCPNLKDRLGNIKDIQDIITYEILPLLEEYWYDDEDSLIQWENALNGVIND